MGGVQKRDVSRSAKIGLVAVVAAATACSSAFGRDQVSWQCNAENGRYSQNPQSISRGVHTLTGQIQFRSGQFGEQWNPTAHIAFTDAASPTNADCFCNGIRASVYPSEPNTVKFFMTFNGQSTGIAQAPVGKPITFKMSIDDEGVLTTVIGKTNPVVQKATLRYPQHDTLHLSCSSGTVSFINVQAQ